MFVRATPHAEGDIEVEFDVDGLRDAITDIATECKLTLPAPPPRCKPLGAWSLQQGYWLNEAFQVARGQIHPVVRPLRECLLSATFGQRVNKDLAKELFGKQAGCREAIEGLQQRSVPSVQLVYNESGESQLLVIHNESIWRLHDYKTKVKVALAFYCAYMPEDGKLVVTIKGSHTNRILGGVVNGHVWIE
jgi:hypothetical protein